MTTSVSAISRQKVSELISSMAMGNLSEVEIEAFKRYVLVSSKLRAGVVDGKLICLWGLIPPTMLSDQAYLWLHTTEAAQEHEFILVRRSQIEIKAMLEEFPRIIGHCEVGAEQSIRWLRWLGASFGDHDGRLVPFEIVRKE